MALGPDRASVSSVWELGRGVLLQLLDLIESFWKTGFTKFEIRSRYTFTSFRTV